MGSEMCIRDRSEDGTLTISEAELLGSSSDVDGAALHIENLELGEGTSGSLTPNDADAEGPRTWTFVPDDNFNGSVSLSYGVSDGELTDTVTTTITVTPVDDPAIFDGDSSGGVTEDASLSSSPASPIPVPFASDTTHVSTINQTEELGGNDYPVIQVSINWDRYTDLQYDPSATWYTDGSYTLSWTLQLSDDPASAVSFSKYMDGGENAGTLAPSSFITRLGENTWVDAEALGYRMGQAFDPNSGLSSVYFLSLIHI